MSEHEKKNSLKNINVVFRCNTFLLQHSEIFFFLGILVKIIKKKNIIMDPFVRAEKNHDIRRPKQYNEDRFQDILHISAASRGHSKIPTSGICFFF